MRRILFMTRKEFKQVFRDPPMVALIFLVPLIQLLILAFVFTTEVKHLKTTIVDLDNTAVSREIVRAFAHTDRFDVIDVSRDPSSIQPDMKSWRTQVAVVIPSHFSRDLIRGDRPAVQVVLDGVDGNSAGVGLGYAAGILRTFGLGYASSPAHIWSPPNFHLVSMEERMVFNPELSSQRFMVPGLVVVLLTILPMMLSSMSLVREKEIGTLEQLLVTPLKKHQLLAGKLLPFLILSYVELAGVTVVAVVVFRIPMAGSYTLLAVLGFAYLFTTLGLGVFISTLSHTQQQAMFVAWFLMVFMLLMSGFFIPIANMPAFLQKLTYLNPMRYFMSITRDIFQKGSTLRYLWIDAVPMTVFGLAIFAFSVAKFQKRLG